MPTYEQKLEQILERTHAESKKNAQHKIDETIKKLKQIATEIVHLKTQSKGIEDKQSLLNDYEKQLSKQQLELVKIANAKISYLKPRLLHQTFTELTQSELEANVALQKKLIDENFSALSKNKDLFFSNPSKTSYDEMQKNLKYIKEAEESYLALKNKLSEMKKTQELFNDLSTKVKNNAKILDQNTKAVQALQTKKTELRETLTSLIEFTSASSSRIQKALEDVETKNPDQVVVNKSQQEISTPTVQPKFSKASELIQRTVQDAFEKITEREKSLSDKIDKTQNQINTFTKKQKSYSDSIDKLDTKIESLTVNKNNSESKINTKAQTYLTIEDKGKEPLEKYNKTMQAINKKISETSDQIAEKLKTFADYAKNILSNPKQIKIDYKVIKSDVVLLSRDLETYKNDRSELKQSLKNLIDTNSALASVTRTRGFEKTMADNRDYITLRPLEEKLKEYKAALASIQTERTFLSSLPEVVIAKPAEVSAPAVANAKKVESPLPVQAKGLDPQSEENDNNKPDQPQVSLPNPQTPQAAAPAAAPDLDAAQTAPDLAAGKMPQPKQVHQQQVQRPTDNNDKKIQAAIPPVAPEQVQVKQTPVSPVRATPKAATALQGLERNTDPAGRRGLKESDLLRRLTESIEKDPSWTNAFETKTGFKMARFADNLSFKSTQSAKTIIVDSTGVKMDSLSTEQAAKNKEIEAMVTLYMKSIDSSVLHHKITCTDPSITPQIEKLLATKLKAEYPEKHSLMRIGGEPIENILMPKAPNKTAEKPLAAIEVAQEQSFSSPSPNRQS